MLGGHIFRWDFGGEFKGALQTSSSEPLAIVTLDLGESQAIVVTGSASVVDVYIDYCLAFELLCV